MAIKDIYGIKNAPDTKTAEQDIRRMALAGLLDDDEDTTEQEKLPMSIDDLQKPKSAPQMPEISIEIEIKPGGESETEEDLDDPDLAALVRKMMEVENAD